MGFFTKIFGKKDENDVLRDAFAHINKIIDDENFQNESLGAGRDLIINEPSFDVNPAGYGPFGFTETNPIPVNGPLGELSYLSRIETLDGDRLMFHRLGPIKLKNPIGKTHHVDVYEAVSINGNQWFVFYLDFYHPKRSRALPKGFQFTKEIPQFSGFNRISHDFPNNFVETREQEKESGLSFAFMPMSKVMPSINAGIYTRPDSHVECLMHAYELIALTLEPEEDQQT
jgi:hypothetical protein